MKYKILLLILGVVVGATVTFFLLPKSGDSEKVIIREFADTSASTTHVEADSALPRNVIESPNVSKELLNSTSKEENFSQESNSKIIIEGETFDFFADNKKTLYEVMLDLEKEGINLKTKKFSSLGYLIEGINGKESNNGYYWTLYINGKEALVGVSTYIPKEGDVSEWKYEKR